jgi:hypothetical protein
MRTFILLVSGALLSQCGSGGSNPSRVSDITIETSYINCSASWMCLGETQARGQVSSRQNYAVTEHQACILDLQRQLAASGLCPGVGATLVSESMQTVLQQKSQTLLTRSSADGEKLYQVLTQYENMVRQLCKGETCYSQWRRQGELSDSLVVWLNFIREKDYRMAPDIGRMASAAAAELCRVSHIANAQWTSWLTSKDIQAHETLHEIQVRSEGGVQLASCDIAARK